MDALSIVFFNRFFERWPDPAVLGRPAGVELGFGPDAAEGADAVVFHLPTIPPEWEEREKAPGQLWIAWSMESRVTCPLLDRPEVARRFDLTMGVERDCDVWAPYFGPGTVPRLLDPPEPKTAPHPVAHLQSNPYDASGRNRYAFELMRKVKIDSYGTFLRNRPEVIPPGWAARVGVMRRYKFTLAFENSFGSDYVTDKLYDPLCVGSVPVYRGSPDVAELAPAQGCYIDASDFSGPEELGAYLSELDRDESAYARYHEWRRRGLSPRFRAHLERLTEPLLVRLAEVVARRLKAR